MKLTWWSHSCWLIETGPHRLVIDPFLSGNPKAPLAADDVACDYLLITHGHGDHLGDAVSIAKRTGATIIANYEVATYCGQQGATVHPMHIGGGHDFPFGRVKLTIAHHGSGLEQDGQMLYLGNPVGLLVTAEGKTVYHAGDTGLFLDMQLIGQSAPIDTALLPIGDNFTMGIDDAVQAVGFLNPRLALPMHYDTFEIIAADPDQFVTQVAAAGGHAQKIMIGESVEI